jgi:hypothetical protein
MSAYKLACGTARTILNVVYSFQNEMSYYGPRLAMRCSSVPDPLNDSGVVWVAHVDTATISFEFLHVRALPSPFAYRHSSRFSFRRPQCFSFDESYSGIGFAPCNASIIAT